MKKGALRLWRPSTSQSIQVAYIAKLITTSKAYNESVALATSCILDPIIRTLRNFLVIRLCRCVPQPKTVKIRFKLQQVPKAIGLLSNALALDPNTILVYEHLSLTRPNLWHDFRNLNWRKCVAIRDDSFTQTLDKRGAPPDQSHVERKWCFSAPLLGNPFWSV